MKKVQWVVLLAFIAIVSAGLYAAQGTITLEGTLVDSNCYLKDHSLTGNDHMGVKACGTACLRMGYPGGILTKSHQYHALVAPSLALAPYVGQEIRVTGSLHNGAVQAAKVEVLKAGKWQELQLKSMM